MALTHSQATLAMKYQPLLEQVQVAMLAYAGTVIAESTGTTDDTNRRNLAFYVVRDHVTPAQIMLSYLIAKNLSSLSLDSGSQNITISDATVDSAVIAAWNDVADALATTTL